MSEQMVYRFSQGSAEMKSLLGGKGANLSEMTRIGLPVPPGFVITTEACNKYFAEGRKIWPELKKKFSTNWSSSRSSPAAVLAGRIPCCSRFAPARCCPCRG